MAEAASHLVTALLLLLGVPAEGGASPAHGKIIGGRGGQGKASGTHENGPKAQRLKQAVSERSKVRNAQQGMATATGGNCVRQPCMQTDTRPASGCMAT